ncbi:uncharacterized protein [Ranitomeya imitator]|uniref:uncharacterized protein isoform X2 n=1 Tax=Ranitomeya imitator TaxID=111125 RepID=UPI0037E7FC8F
MFRADRRAGKISKKNLVPKQRMASYDRMTINVHRLILLVHNSPILWDPTCDDYSNRVKRDDAWDKVVAELYPECLGMVPERKKEILKDIRTRWRSVRDRFKKNVQEQERSGSAPKVKKCPHYDNLQFLLSIRELQETKGNHVEDSQGQGSMTEESTSIISSCKDIKGPASSVSQAAVDCTPNIFSQTQDRRGSNVRAIRRQAVRRCQQRTKTLRQTAEATAVTQKAMQFLHRMDSNDNWDYFCASIADGFRKVPAENQWACASVMCTVVNLFQKYRHTINSCEIATGIKEIAERQLQSQINSGQQQTNFNYPDPNLTAFTAPHASSFPAPHSSSFPAPHASSLPGPHFSFPATHSSSTPNSFLQTSTLSSLHSPLSTASSSQPDFVPNISSPSDSATSVTPTDNLPEPTLHTLN